MHDSAINQGTKVPDDDVYELLALIQVCLSHKYVNSVLYDFVQSGEPASDSAGFFLSRTLIQPVLCFSQNSPDYQ